MRSGRSMDNPVTQTSLPAERFDLRHPCHTQGRKYGDLAAIIGTTNEKPFTNIIPNQPTILVISNFLKESAFSKSKTSHASHGWEAVNNHMWPDKPIQAGQITFRRVRKLKHSCHAQEFLLTGAAS